MPTWPNATKASTTNLDAGTDRPSLARADLKQNVDNVNDIIDMLYIPSTPSNNQILKYNSTNSRFELSSDSGMTGFTVAGDTGSSQTINDGNTLTIAGGTNLTSTASATDTITIDLDSTLTGLTAVTVTTLNTNAIVGVTLNGNITVTPNGTGDVQLVADTVQVGDSNANATVTTNGTGDLVLNTNNGTNSGSITISQGANGAITLAPNGTGDVNIDADTLRIGDSNANATVTTNGTGDLILNTNAGSNSSSITIQDAANGNIVLAPNGTGRVQVSGTTSNAGGIDLFEDTDNGTNKVLLTAPASIASDFTLTLPGAAGSATLGYLNVPAVGTKTGSYTLATTDVGEYVQVGSGGSITIPNNTFAEGDVVLIANNHTAAITITCTITDAYIAGTDTDKASVSLATRGVASILFLSATRCIISGNVT